MPYLRDRYTGAMLALACGDALGTSVEFSPRGTFKPVTAMRGGGPFDLEIGHWSDDTSMALCLAESLISCNAFDPKDQMERYVRWWKFGHFSPIKYCFDIGTTTKRALIKFQQTGIAFSGPTESNSAGNGSLMRLAPVVLFAYPDRQLVDQCAISSSRTTHGAAEAIEACRLLGSILCSILDGLSKEQLLEQARELRFTTEVNELLCAEFLRKPEAEIRGSSHCLRSLEAALWCFFNTETLESGILKAVNLGDDADTTGAITGQLCGAFYGASSIPGAWLETLAMRDTIESMANSLYENRAVAYTVRSK